MQNQFPITSKSDRNNKVSNEFDIEQTAINNYANETSAPCGGR